MTPEINPAELNRLVAQYVSSVEELEILCLLSQNPQKSWSIKDVFQVIQSSKRSVTTCLERFAAKGWIREEAPGLYRFAPRQPELAGAAAKLQQAYRERPATVVQLIYQPPGTSA